MTEQTRDRTDQLLKAMAIVNNASKHMLHDCDAFVLLQRKFTLIGKEFDLLMDCKSEVDPNCVFYAAAVVDQETIFPLCLYPAPKDACSVCERPIATGGKFENPDMPGYAYCSEACANSALSESLHAETAGRHPA